ncbi:MAG: hypothetical protein R3B90_18385 [Planctomycetaceae bacterium]
MTNASMTTRVWRHPALWALVLIAGSPLAKAGIAADQPAASPPVVATCPEERTTDAAADRVSISAVAPPSVEVVKRLDLDPHYTKHVFVGDFSVVSGQSVADAALLEAAWLIRQMIGHRPDVLSAMAKNRVRFAIMGVSEMTTDLPEHSDLTPKSYWNRRARGLGATPQRPAVSCGEENLLCYPGDPYSTENILIHEFGHAIHQMGLNTTNPDFDDRLKLTFDQAMESGLWKDKYASTNRFEYWAEGVQSWFDTNRENDREHNHVNTRAEIIEYDPGLAKLLSELFGEGDWRYTRPETRADAPHLAGWNRNDSPRFAWPKQVSEAYERCSKRTKPPRARSGRMRRPVMRRDGSRSARPRPGRRASC